MVKKPVQFRFSADTLSRLDWLQGHLDLNRSEVVRLAVAELYHRHRQAFLVQNSAGRWILAIGNSVIQVDEQAMARLIETAPGFVEQLRGGVSSERAVLGFLEMLLALVGSEEQ